METDQEETDIITLVIQLLTLVSGIIITVITLIHKNRLEVIHAVNTS